MSPEDQQYMREVFNDHAVPGFTTLKALSQTMRANDNVFNEKTAHEDIWNEEGTARHIARVAVAVQALLKELYIDAPNDHNTADTAMRVAKMYVTEIMRGRYTPEPDITEFPNAMRLDELYTTGPITVRSICAHHLVPIIGQAWIGIIPGHDSVIGLSKFNRLVDWVFARPQIQEEATIQLADILWARAKPKGLAVVVKATHMCLTWRGVRESMDSRMTTSVVRGAMAEVPAARAEFFALIRD